MLIIIQRSKQVFDRLSERYSACSICISVLFGSLFFFVSSVIKAGDQELPLFLVSQINTPSDYGCARIDPLNVPAAFFLGSHFPDNEAVEHESLAYSKRDHKAAYEAQISFTVLSTSIDEQWQRAVVALLYDVSIMGTVALWRTIMRTIAVYLKDYEGLPESDTLTLLQKGDAVWYRTVSGRGQGKQSEKIITNFWDPPSEIPQCGFKRSYTVDDLFNGNDPPRDQQLYHTEGVHCPACGGGYCKIAKRKKITVQPNENEEEVTEKRVKNGTKTSDQKYRKNRDYQVYKVYKVLETRYQGGIARFELECRDKKCDVLSHDNKHLTRDNEYLKALCLQLQSRCCLLEKEKQELDTQKEELQSRCDELEKEKQELDTQKAELQSRCDEFEKEKQELDTQMEDLETYCEEREQECGELSKLHGRAVDTIDRLLRSQANQVRDYYLATEQSPIHEMTTDAGAAGSSTVLCWKNIP
ncbi:hypothetical protein [Endozoicomonas montiporae]|nr:hypothetical protein [Endozoicomonas montiporae]